MAIQLLSRRGRDASRRRLSLVTILGTLAVAGTVSGQQLRPLHDAPRPVNTKLLRQIEDNCLPRTLVPGPPRFENLLDYYREENAELIYRFGRAREVFDANRPRPFQRITLIAGSAGAGKTFLKQQVLGDDYPPELVCVFDIRDLYADWERSGRAFQKPDLHAEDIVFNTLPALRDRSWPGLYDYLNDQTGVFFVIDSLDEIHPHDYVPILEQIEKFAFDEYRQFVHVVVLGRGLAFRDYWQIKAGYYPTSRMNLYMLETPQFTTTGDLLVSSWNYHVFRHKLSWGSGEPFSFSDFRDWAGASFSLEGRFRDHVTSPPGAIRNDVLEAVERLGVEHRFINTALRNLAGNSILREIIDRHVRNGLPCDERSLKEEYFEKWLERDTKSDNRPSIAKPEHLQEYMRVLESLAAKIVREKRLDSRGFFVLEDNETIEFDYRGRILRLPAYMVLNRSGLKYVDPRTPGGRRYRFEPIWFHRLLVDRYNSSVSSGVATR